MRMPPLSEEFSTAPWQASHTRLQQLKILSTELFFGVTQKLCEVPADFDGMPWQMANH